MIKTHVAHEFIALPRGISRETPADHLPYALKMIGDAIILRREPPHVIIDGIGAGFHDEGVAALDLVSNPRKFLRVQAPTASGETSFGLVAQGKQVHHFVRNTIHQSYIRIQGLFFKIMDTILFLAGIVTFVPKDTIVSINEEIFTVGPSGVSLLDTGAKPAYVVRYDPPMQKNWPSIISHMKSGKMTIRERDGDKNIGEKVINIMSMFL